MLILTARHGTPGASRSDPVEGERESTEVRILRESTCHPGDLKCLHGWDLKALERYPEQCFLCHLM